MFFYSPTNNTNIHYFRQQILLFSPTEVNLVSSFFSLRDDMPLTEPSVVMLRIPSGFDSLPSDDTDFYSLRSVNCLQTSVIKYTKFQLLFLHYLAVTQILLFVVLSLDATLLWLASMANISTYRYFYYHSINI